MRRQLGGRVVQIQVYVQQVTAQDAADFGQHRLLQ
jgi:hypothetical protein